MIAFGVVTMLAAGACKKDAAEGTAAAGEKKEEATAARTSEKTVITINGEKISESMFTAAAEGLPAQMQQAITTAEGKKALGDEIVRMKLLEQEARRLNLDDKPEVANQMELMDMNILAASALQQIADKKPSEQELRAYYEKNKTKYELISARQIVLAYRGGQLPAPQGTTPMTEAEAMAKAESIIERIRGGESFASVAKKTSHEPGVDQSGGLIRFARGSAPVELERALANLQPNGITPPIKTPLAIHIVQLLGRESSSFEQIKPMIERQMAQERVDAALADLRKKAKVEFNTEFFPTNPPAPAAAKK